MRRSTERCEWYGTGLAPGCIHHEQVDRVGTDVDHSEAHEGILRPSAARSARGRRARLGGQGWPGGVGPAGAADRPRRDIEVRRQLGASSSSGPTRARRAPRLADALGLGAEVDQVFDAPVAIARRIEQHLAEPPDAGV